MDRSMGAVQRGGLISEGKEGYPLRVENCALPTWRPLSCMLETTAESWLTSNRSYGKRGPDTRNTNPCGRLSGDRLAARGRELVKLKIEGE